MTKMLNDLRELDEWQLQYIETALWSSTDESREDGGDPMDANYSLADLAPETVQAMAADCDRFRERAGDWLDEHDDPTMAAHDFWLTRNGHGAGFWDGDWPRYGDALTAMVGWRTDFAEVTLYVGDDGMIYHFAG
jgi:hypothetical protein